MVEDIIIIGSGPAGLTAALYTAREDFKPVVITGLSAGGQLLLTTTVENYPAFPDGVGGTDLVELMRKQAEKFGARFIGEDVTDADFSSRPFKIKTASQAFEANSVIIATGASARWLGIPSEQKFIGRGVSSCATCMPPHSLIVSNPSVQEIETLRAGQRVLTNDGTFRVVENVTSRQFSGNLVTIKTRFFRAEEVSVTPNHPFLTVNLERGTGANYHNFKLSKPVWKDAGELSNKDILLYPIPKGRYRKTIYIAKELGLRTSAKGEAVLGTETHTSHRLPNKIRITREFALLVGYYLADGYAHSRGVSFAFNKDELYYAEDCKRLIKKLFGLDSTIKREKSVLKVTSSSMMLSMLFEKLFGKYSHEKMLPEYFVFLEPALQKELVKGLWRGDGYMGAKDFVLSTSSRVLAEQVKMMLLRLNILPTVEKRKFETLKHSIIEGRHVTFKHDVYQVRVGSSSAKTLGMILGVTPPMISGRKRFNAHGWIKDGFAYLPITAISRKPYEGPVYNLAVQDNNTYVTTSGIVHNCDAPFYKGKDVIVVGGGDTAMEDSLFLTKFVNSVTIVHRRDQFRASKIMQERVKSNPKIKIIWNSVVEEITGDAKVTGVKLRNVLTNESTELQVGGVFVAVGYEPNTKFLQGKLELDQNGYVVAKDEVKTAIEGVFVAGDVADHVYKQAITAAGSGAKAALEVRTYLQNLKYTKQSG